MKVREIPDVAIEFIKLFEGCRLHVYIDIAGLKTIGIGHLIRKGEDFSAGITREQAEELLKKDLLNSAASIMRLISSPLSENQYASLLSFAFNLGGGALQRSSLRSKLNRYEYLDASEEFKKWVWAGNRISKGLIRRREAEKLLFLS